MERIGFARTELTIGSGSKFVAVDGPLEIFVSGNKIALPPFEVSLDCMVCRRTDRTVNFAHVGREGECTPTGHAFPGRLLELRTTDSGAAATFRYSFEPFIDTKYPDRQRIFGWEPGAPTWARFNFLVTCGSCGACIEESTQTNLVRPWSCSCGSCGAKLFDDLAPPTLSWEPAPAAGY